MNVFHDLSQGGTITFRGLKNKLKAVFFFVLLVTVIGGGSFVFSDFTSNRLPSLPKECFDKAKEYDKWICFKPYFEELVNKVSPAYAMVELKNFKNRKIIDDCHLNAHFIGEAALEKYDFDVGKAFASCEFGCIEGCFHGVMEGYVRYEADPYTVTSKIKNMCASVSSSNQEVENLLRSQCAHGIGHGLVAHDFLPVDEALVACRGIDYEGRCMGGAIMEHIEQYLSLEEDKLKEILPEICKPFLELDDPAAVFMCANNIGIALMWYTKHDLTFSKKLCEELETPEYIQACKISAEEGGVINLTD